jgi:pimeloyl-ACP methyl ester carboxylesterase
MPTLDHEGVPLADQIRGNGDPVLLIHGLGCRGADWVLQVAALESRVPVSPHHSRSSRERGEPATARDTVH